MRPPRTIVVFAIAVGTLVLAAAAGPFVASLVYPAWGQSVAARKVVTWNIAAGQAPPATTLPGGSELIHFIQGPCSLILNLPGGRTVGYSIEAAQARGKPGMVRHIGIEFPLQTPDLARACAILLLKEWDISGEHDFDAWIAEGCPQGRMRGLDGRNWSANGPNGPLNVGVCVRAGDPYGPVRPLWLVELNIAFNPPMPLGPAAPPPATTSSAGTPAR